MKLAVELRAIHKRSQKLDKADHPFSGVGEDALAPKGRSPMTIARILKALQRWHKWQVQASPLATG